MNRAIRRAAQKMADKIETFQKQHGVKVAVVGTGLALSAGNASAALDPAITAAFTSLQTNFADLLAAAYPVMIAISVGLVIFGMVKMFIHKAAGR